jgi:trafficking protein particle complex subunit 2
MKFVLLHEAKNEEGIRAFFTEVWELYVKVCTHTVRGNRLIVRHISLVSTTDNHDNYSLQTAMNPFHRSDRVIRSPVFDARVRASAKKYL